jgi:hypothetical protein
VYPDHDLRVDSAIRNLTWVSVSWVHFLIILIFFLNRSQSEDDDVDYLLVHLLELMSAYVVHLVIRYVECFRYFGISIETWIE